MLASIKDPTFPDGCTKLQNIIEFRCYSILVACNTNISIYACVCVYTYIYIYMHRYYHSIRPTCASQLSTTLDWWYVIETIGIIKAISSLRSILSSIFDMSRVIIGRKISTYVRVFMHIYIYVHKCMYFLFFSSVISILRLCK